MLPKASVPFFVPNPFKVKADMYKMGSHLVGQSEEKLFHLDADYPHFVNAKLELLKHHAKHARCYVRDDLEHLEACLWQLAQTIATDQPTYFEFSGERLTSKLLGLSLDKTHGLGLEFTPPIFPELSKVCYAHLESLDPFDQLCDFLSLSLQEDLVIMHKTGPAATADRAECLLVALPSHWDPLEKCGLDFGAIHQPVADNAPLMKSQHNLLKAMTQKGPFVRYNWSLATTEALSQNSTLLSRELRLKPLTDTDNPDILLDALHFRMERQTFHAFPDLQRGLFAIRIYQEPLRKTVSSATHTERLHEAVITMSDAMLRYKGINRYKETLLQALGD